MSKNPPLEKYQICLMVADGEHIGSDLGDAIPPLEAPASSTIHQVKGGILQDADRKLFAVQIQMFSFLRPLPPTYLVVAGEMR